MKYVWINLHLRFIWGLCKLIQNAKIATIINISWKSEYKLHFGDMTIERLSRTTCTWMSTCTSNFPCITSSILNGHMVYVNCTSCIIRVVWRLQVSTYVWYFDIYLKILHVDKVYHDELYRICIFLYMWKQICVLSCKWK